MSNIQSQGSIISVEASQIASPGKPDGLGSEFGSFEKESTQPNKRVEK
tara:strand:- start:585 stop:728 length:144 start_codon:yes stop_codon:yes gene_type:complete